MQHFLFFLEVGATWSFASLKYHHRLWSVNLAKQNIHKPRDTVLCASYLISRVLATYLTTTIGQKIYILQIRELSDYGNTPPWLHKYVIRKGLRARNLILTTALKEPTAKLIRCCSPRLCTAPSE